MWLTVLVSEFGMGEGEGTSAVHVIAIVLSIWQRIKIRSIIVQNILIMGIIIFTI